MNINFNGKIVKPSVTTPKDWLLRHAKHEKLNQVCRDELGGGPDLRVIFCADCKEIFVAGVIKKEVTNGV